MSTETFTDENGVETPIPDWAKRVRELTQEITDHQEAKAAEKKAILVEQFEAGLNPTQIAARIGISRERVSLILGRRVSKSRDKIRDAIAISIKALDEGAGVTVTDIWSGVNDQLKTPVARSSVASYLRTGEGRQFVRVNPGVYKLMPE